MVTSAPTPSRAPREIPCDASLPRLGAWELVHRLGAGSWTSVYQARPCGCAMNEPGDYALKLLNPRHQQNSLAIEMLRREASVAGAVTHPHLSAVLMSHLSHSPYYLVLPRLSGGTIRSLLDYLYECRGGKKEGVPVPHALWIARQVTEALVALHDRGWIHGDVKPSNIFVSPAGHATLIDLGFARRRTGAEGAASDDLHQGIFVGTPAYAAPEIFRDEPRVAPSSDVYSLGVTLFEMLTGRPPFSSRDVAELAQAHLERNPPHPRRFVPQLHPRIVRLLQRMLAKNPSWRPPSCELLDTLVRLEIETLDERPAA